VLLLVLVAFDDHPEDPALDICLASALILQDKHILEILRKATITAFGFMPWL
jgi:hypothetical protein